MRMRAVRAATTLANGIGSQYTLSPVKLCSVSQMPSKPTVSAKHAWVTCASMAPASSSGEGDSPSVSQPKRMPIGLRRASSRRVGQYGGDGRPDQGRRARMKITKVEAFHVDWGSDRSRSAWVRIATDEGVWGLGEASPMVHGNASLEILASAFRPMLLGADPLQPRVLQDRLFHQHIKLGPEGAFTGALAAIDIGLWDLKGKALGQPVWKLLGGAWRRELPFYASIGGNGQRTVDEVCRVVEEWLEFGPAQVKIRFDADKTARAVDLAGDIAKA